MNTNQLIASDLLKINAVTLSPNEPFTWASGIKAPIYTDNRITISFPEVRTHIADGLSELIRNKFPEVKVIGGVATAGIPHAAIVADKMDLPMIYVRSKPKDHGRGKQMEGRINQQDPIVLIDDLLSTGKSVLNAAQALKNEGYNVIGVVAIFSYELPDSTKNFKEAGIEFDTLTNYSTIIEQAKAENSISDDELVVLRKWRDDPWNWM
ncbi:orotate phosphoribosyltransferase [Apilactobacillus kunkeei]|uniref:Orotate phosphoribosyltransferase n=2 Tax=Apilactobacillus kunkeei TaxID=148814 RepID=A0A0P7JSI5_9LACO|nr:orotate phosphoribosyltransferase [Apilactobacillus kunkeei]KOY70898.1 Orotate phosphoribosyltransferase [Apilactobacillus kunkeei DSM 12361 = ATCC 700308]KPN79489.1 Orotate phosphoribosyltransferase [Apilactobacillus kunkeei]KRK22951.1 orotate phosphoribosyltransferase [Apilactobacillus kunkeei DSM 12361 = ATCC 700308]MCK8634613.1 orotate phosphoribosyltransferase [Apilactobacillus kunkeei]QYU53052.1 orotate phosphoribosyltransferase [Apilactobacillus kunkeei]